MKAKNDFRMSLDSRSVNEAFSRSTVAAFTAQLDPTVDEITDIKTAVSEAVTNCIVHAYPDSIGEIYISVQICEGRLVRIEIKDKGRGIEDVALARKPLYTTSPESERSGMGFTVMESFTDKVTVRSKPGKGTAVVLYKQLSAKKKAE